MSEKVKLTQEQANAIDNRLQSLTKVEIVQRHLKDNWHVYTSLNYLTLDRLIRALYIGYEVEVTFKVGDWVVCDRGDIGIVTSVEKTEEVWADWSGIRAWSHPKELRHATPEEISKEKERRKTKELKTLPKYSLLFIGGNMYEFIRYVENDKHQIKVRDFYTKEADSWMKDVSSLKIICYAEDRKDITHD